MCCCCLGGAFCPPFLFPFPRLMVYVSEQRCAVEGWCRTRLRLSDFSYYFTAYLTQDVFFLSCLLVIHVVPDKSFEWERTGRGASAVGYCFRCRALGRQMLGARRVPEQRGTDPSPDRPSRVKHGLAQPHLPQPFINNPLFPTLVPPSIPPSPLPAMPLGLLTRFSTADSQSSSESALVWYFPVSSSTSPDSDSPPLSPGYPIELFPGYTNPDDFSVNLSLHADDDAEVRTRHGELYMVMRGKRRKTLYDCYGFPIVNIRRKQGSLFGEYEVLPLLIPVPGPG